MKYESIGTFVIRMFVKDSYFGGIMTTDDLFLYIFKALLLMEDKKSLSEKYPPSEPCGCEICLYYCKRPGWWTVEEADSAINAGYANRMMLEMSPDLSFAVLSPAFKGCEVSFATNKYAANGCNFLVNNLCQLHSTGHMPLECRFCHHDRRGMGEACHLDIEKEWNTQQGQAIVRKWCFLTKFKGY